MDVCGKESWSARLATFGMSYSGATNAIMLAQCGFYHDGNNIIKCSNCSQLFISWWNDSDDGNFWQRHQETLCRHMNTEYTYWGDKIHDQSVEKWMQKEYMDNLVKSNLISRQILEKYVNEFLHHKGNDASVRLFKRFLYFLKNFCNHFHLP